MQLLRYLFLVMCLFLTNYNLKMKMEQTNKMAKEEMQIEQRHARTLKNRQLFIPDHVLLICNGAGTIVFAQGDPKVFDCRLEQLQHRSLFELGFSRHSLELLKKQKHSGLFEHLNRKKLSLEFINQEVIRAQTEKEFNEDKEIYLKKIVLKCSLMMAKFGQLPVQPGQCRIKRHPVHLFNSHQNQQAFVLVQANVQTRCTRFYSKYEDYVATCQKLPANKRVIKKR